MLNSLSDKDTQECLRRLALARRRLHLLGASVVPVDNGTSGGQTTVAVLLGLAQATDVSGAEQTANKGQANGYAGLDSGGKVPTGQLPAAVLGSVNYQGTWNASTNSPTLTSSTGTKGYYYTVSVAGTTALDGISQWNVGDHAVYNGSAWEKIDGVASEVISVAGRTGVVTLGVADVTGAAPLASPTLTGTPAAPTATSGTNTTQIATTAFVQAAVSGVSGGSAGPATPQVITTGATSGSPTAISSTYDVLCLVNKGTGAATFLTLPASPSNGARCTVKDGKGDAATNSITITPASGTVDAAANFVLSQNRGAVTFTYNGTEWSIGITYFPDTAAGVAISGLSNASSLSGSDVGVVSQSGTDGKFTLAQLASFVFSAGGTLGKALAPRVVPLTDVSSITADASLGNVFTVTLGGNRTLANPTNLTAGQELTFIATQDGTGTRTLAYGNLFTWPGGTPPALSTAASAVDLISCIYDGSKLRCGIGKAYA